MILQSHQNQWNLSAEHQIDQRAACKKDPTLKYANKIGRFKHMGIYLNQMEQWVIQDTRSSLINDQNVTKNELQCSNLG